MAGTANQVLILLVDDDPVLAPLLERLVKRQGYRLRVAQSGLEALECLAKERVQVAFLDLNLPGFNGLQLLQHIKGNYPDTEVIILTERGTVETAVSALKLGAYDYLQKPFRTEEAVLAALKKVVEKVVLVEKIHQLESSRAVRDSFCGLHGKSAKLQDLFRLIESVAPSTANVLVLGESGTGKELVARAIHQASPRAERGFVVVNCSALAETLLESELFGHVRGAFTGAIADKRGLFEEADGGTLFLDEIGDLSPALQVKLLRVLQERGFERVGGAEKVKVDIRVIAATNRDIWAEVQKGNFREDLYYRLNVIGVTLPPLRERAEDIPLLAYHFLEKFAGKTSKPVTKISVDAMQTLQEYRWVGNVRELENVVERAVVLCDGEVLTARDLPPRLLGEVFYVADQPSERELLKLPYQDAKERALHLFHRTYLNALLQQVGGNLTLASSRAGMDRSNFKKIIKKYEIHVGEFKK